MGANSHSKHVVMAIVGVEREVVQLQRLNLPTTVQHLEPSLCKVTAMQQHQDCAADEAKSQHFSAPGRLRGKLEVAAKLQCRLENMNWPPRMRAMQRSFACGQVCGGLV